MRARNWLPLLGLGIAAEHDLLRHVARKGIRPGIAPDHVDRQRRQRQDQGPADMTGAEQIDRRICGIQPFEQAPVRQEAAGRFGG